MRRFLRTHVRVKVGIARCLDLIGQPSLFTTRLKPLWVYTMKDEDRKKEDMDTEVGIDKPVDPQERVFNPLDAVDEDLHANQEK
jgi:hypothetical protein